MNNNWYEGAIVSDLAYKNYSAGARVKLGGYEYAVVSAKNRGWLDGGYAGYVLQNISTGHYFFVSRGTEPNKPSDLITDADMALGWIKPVQFAAAESYFHSVQKTYGLNASNTTIAGQSLGGALSQYLGAISGFQTLSYNPYGIGNKLTTWGVDSKPSQAYDNITNIVTINDPVARLLGSKMIGNTAVVFNNYNQDSVFGHSMENFIGKNNALEGPYAAIKWVNNPNAFGGTKWQGGFWNDLMQGDNTDNAMNGNAGNDRLHGRSGNDWLWGGVGNDKIWGDEGNDYVLGGDGNDELDGGLGTDIIDGGKGTDTVLYTQATGSVRVDLSKNQASGFLGDDTLLNVENVTGGRADDILIGNALNNVLDGGLGRDILTGGAGADSFVFNTPLRNGNVDIITDFRLGLDVIKLDDAVFSKLSGSSNLWSERTLKREYFALDRASDTNDYIVYDQSKGYLYYDTDGSGPGQASLFAELTTGLALQFSSIRVI